MAQIVELLAGDREMQLGNEQFGRTMSMGTNWNKIRVGMRFSFLATSDINSSGLVMGVCQGTSNMYKSATCTDFIGGHLGATINATTYTYNSGPPAYINTGGTSTLGVRRINNTNTTAAGTNANIYAASNPATLRNIWIVDIARGPVNYVITNWFPDTSAKCQVDIPLNGLLSLMETDDSPPGLASFSSINVAYSGSALFDSVNISWNNGIQPVVISDICVLRVN